MSTLMQFAATERMASAARRVNLEELDCFGLGVDAVGEEDGMDFLVAVDGDEQLGITGRQGARFAKIHYLVADLAHAQYLTSNA